MSPVDQAVIDLVVGSAVWGVPGFGVDSFVHVVRALDRNLSARSKADQLETFLVNGLLLKTRRKPFQIRVCLSGCW
jgi:hypothetical protein